jgi:integrase
MATVFKRQGQANWYARFMIKGKDYCISTGTPNKKEAVAFMKKRVAMLKGDASLAYHFDELQCLIDQLPEGDQEKTRREFARRLMGGSIAKLKTDDAWQAWIDSPLRRNPSEQMIRAYKIYWNRFAKWAQQHDIEYVHETTPTNAQDFCAELWKSGISPNTYNKYVKFLKGAFDVLREKAGLVLNIWSDIPTMRLETKSKRDLTSDELAKVCGTATGNLRYLFAVGLYTGMRLGDACNLKWENIDFRRKLIEIVPSKTKRQNKKLRLPIHPVLGSLLRELKKKSKTEYLFQEEFELYSKHPAYVSRKIQQHFRNCGIETNEDTGDGQRRNRITRVGFHSLRHSFVSLCAASGVPQVAIQELVGHGSPTMTAVYSHSNDKQKASAIAALPTIDFGSGKR